MVLPLPLLLLQLLACSFSTVAAFGCLGSGAVGGRPHPIIINPHVKLRWGPAYMVPCGGKQQDDTIRIRRRRPGSPAITQGYRGASGPTSRGYAAPSGRVVEIKTAGILRHRMGMLNNGGGEMEFFCDQCGDILRVGAASSSPPPLFSPPPEPPLAVCGAPGCGVSFSQCVGCKEEYAGCCSAACQALIKQRETATAQMAAPAPGEQDPRAERRLNSSGGGELAGLGGASSASSNRARLFQRNAGSAVLARASSSDQEGSNRSEETLTKLSETPGGGSNAKNSQARGTGEGKQKPVEGGGESLLESYASRHSERESSPLAVVREGTNRSQPGGAHMVSGHLQGELLKLLVKLSGAKRVLDIGTFTGYSALAFAEALPEDGVVVTLESDARAADTAREHFASSEHGGKIQLLLGKAMDGIDQMKAEDAPQFDVIFVDADKKRYWDYYDKLLAGPRPLLGPKGMLLADNVLFHELVPLAEAMGAAAAAAAAEPPAQGAVGMAQIPEGFAGEVQEIDRVKPSVSETGLRESWPGPGTEEKRPGVVGGGVLPATPRRLKIAESLDGFNKRVKEDSRVEVLMLPLRDGLSVVTWRRGGYPTGDKP